MSAFIRPSRPEERILRCSAARGKSTRRGYKLRVTCEKPALHGFGCAIDPDSGIAGIHVVRREALRHAGRNGQGQWYFWEES